MQSQEVGRTVAKPVAEVRDKLNDHIRRRPSIAKMHTPYACIHRRHGHQHRLAVALRHNDTGDARDSDLVHVDPPSTGRPNLSDHVLRSIRRQSDSRLRHHQDLGPPRTPHPEHDDRDAHSQHQAKSKDSSRLHSWASSKRELIPSRLRIVSDQNWKYRNVEFAVE
jgi:hypothetical protein